MVPENVCVGRTPMVHLIFSNPTGLYLHPKNNTCFSGEGNLKLNKLGKIITSLKSNLFYYLLNLN